MSLCRGVRIAVLVITFQGTLAGDGVEVTAGDKSVVALITSSGAEITAPVAAVIAPTNLGHHGTLGPYPGEPAIKIGEPAIKAIAGGAAVAQQWLCNGVTVSVTDQYLGSPTSITINTTIEPTGKTSPFTSALFTNLTLSEPRSASFWTSWGKGCVQNQGRSHGMCFAGGQWEEPFSPEALPQTMERFRYGATLTARDSLTIPIVTLLDTSKKAGLALALSPVDPILELNLHAGPRGAAFGRELLRLGVTPIKFTANLLGLTEGACWRPALQWLTTAYPDFFEPWVLNAADFEGLGSYSWNQDVYNTTRAKALGFKTNWDLSGTFMPYDGLFLPYQNKWENLGPINGGLAQYNVTYDMINSYYERIQDAGFHSLSYFDIGNWGTRTNTNYPGPHRTCGSRPNGEPAPCPDPDGANAFLRDYLYSALLHHGWSVPGGKFMVHHYDWVGTTDMDTIEPYFEDLIVEQARRHLSKLPAFEGIAIDRLDYSEFFNYDKDDGISWVPVNSSGAATAVDTSRSMRLAVCDESDPQQHFRINSSGFVISDSGLCLDVWNCGVASGTQVDLYRCHGTGGACCNGKYCLNQIFELNQAGQLRSALKGGAVPDYCIGAKMPSSPVVALWPCSSSSPGIALRWQYNATERLLLSMDRSGMCLSAHSSSSPAPPAPPKLDVWGPARALRLSYRHTFERLHEELHEKQPPQKKRVMLNNCNSLCRIDEMRAFDGTFSEGASLNAVAWTGIRQPSILWTYALSDDTNALAKYFQQHLLLNVYPMAPMPKNDHSITPGSSIVERAYRNYAPLFDAMHGARWLLSAQPATISGGGGAITNVLAFNVSAVDGASALLLPVMLGNASASTAQITLELGPTRKLGWPILAPGLAAALLPGADSQWQPLANAKEKGSNRWTLVTPLSEGCAMVSVPLHKSP